MQKYIVETKREPFNVINLQYYSPHTFLFSSLNIVVIIFILCVSCLTLPFNIMHFNLNSILYKVQNIFSIMQYMLCYIREIKIFAHLNALFRAVIIIFLYVLKTSQISCSISVFFCFKCKLRSIDLLYTYL